MGDLSVRGLVGVEVDESNLRLRAPSRRRLVQMALIDSANDRL
jgi:hypothetical protein